ncbi:MAG: site-specific integrase [Bryobacteraceae bacterium]
MQDLYELFIKDRRYSKGVSARTEGWYRESWRVFQQVFIGASPESISKSDFSPIIEALCRRGVSPITINTYARAINAFLRWLHEERSFPNLVRIPRLKEPEMVVLTFRPEHVQQLMQYRPSCWNQRRAQTMALLILDTGMRLKEVLSLRVADIDLDNLLITIRDGKGGKQRVVPITIELRKVLFKYISAKPSSGLVFCSRDGVQLSQNNVRRDFKAVCKRLKIVGVKGGFHVLRHTFAVNYIRNGGDVFRLQRVLGHTTLDMTRRYVNLQTEDLQAVHSKLSLLSRRG